MSLFYENARVGLQAQIDRARKAQQLNHNDLVHWRDQCLDIKFTRWMNRSFQGPQRIRYNEICEEARNIPRMLATEALRKKSFLHKNMPWLSIPTIAAIAGMASFATLTFLLVREFRPRTSLGRKRERDIEADADSEAPPQKVLRRAISPEPGSTDRRTCSFPDASAFPPLRTSISTSTILSTSVSLSVDTLSSHTKTDSVSSVESEREELVEKESWGFDHRELNEDEQIGQEDEGDDCANKHGDNDSNDNDKTESVQAENGDNDDEEVKSNRSDDEDEEVKSDRSEDEETKEVNIDDSEVKETDNEA